MQLPGAFIHLRIHRALFFFPLSSSQYLTLTTPHSYLQLLFLILCHSTVPLWPLALKCRDEYLLWEQFSFWPPLEAAASAGCQSHPDQAQLPTESGRTGCFCAWLLVGVVPEGKHRAWQWQETRHKETEDNWGVRTDGGMEKCGKSKGYQSWRSSHMRNAKGE